MSKIYRAEVNVVYQEYGKHDMFYTSEEAARTIPPYATVNFQTFHASIEFEDIEGQSPTETALEEALAYAMAKRTGDVI